MEADTNATLTLIDADRLCELFATAGLEDRLEGLAADDRGTGAVVDSR